MRVLLTGIPSYLVRTVAKASGATVVHKPYFDDIRTKQDVTEQVKKIANTGAKTRAGVGSRGQANGASENGGNACMS